jgi:hypothetical protein
MTWYCRPWWMTSLPLMYSKIAESPDASEMDRWIFPSTPFGATTMTGRKASLRISATASSTVAKLSSMYCVQAEMPLNFVSQSNLRQEPLIVSLPEGRCSFWALLINRRSHDCLFYYFNLLIKKKFALLNPNIYKIASGAAGAGAAIGECPNALI